MCMPGGSVHRQALVWSWLLWSWLRWSGRLWFHSHLAQITRQADTLINELRGANQPDVNDGWILEERFPCNPPSAHLAHTLDRARLLAHGGHCVHPARARKRKHSSARRGLGRGPRPCAWTLLDPCLHRGFKSGGVHPPSRQVAASTPICVRAYASTRTVPPRYSIAP